MTSPAESNRGRFYSERVLDKTAEYAWKQRVDIVDGLLETNRLGLELFTAIFDTTTPASELVSQSVELWSAAVHYSSALMANLGAGVAGMGYEIRKGKADDQYPHRVIEFGRLLPAEPTPSRFWKIGAVDGQLPVFLPLENVFMLQSFQNQGTTKWDVIFNLSGAPPQGVDTWTGTYCLELKLGERDANTHHEYVYLDPPRPAG